MSRWTRLIFLIQPTALYQHLANTSNAVLAFYCKTYGHISRIRAEFSRLVGKYRERKAAGETGIAIEPEPLE